MCEYVIYFITVTKYTVNFLVTNNIACENIDVVDMVNLGRAVGKSNCFHDKGHKADCTISNYPYMAVFGIIQIILSQIPNFAKLSFLSLMAAVMSFAYATIGIGLAIATVVGT